MREVSKTEEDGVQVQGTRSRCPSPSTNSETLMLEEEVVASPFSSLGLRIPTCDIKSFSNSRVLLEEQNMRELAELGFRRKVKKVRNRSESPQPGLHV
jgi:hypothetical protein